MIRNKLFSAIEIDVGETLEKHSLLLYTEENERLSLFFDRLEFRKNYFNIVSGVYNKQLSGELLKELVYKILH